MLSIVLRKISRRQRKKVSLPVIVVLLVPTGCRRTSQKSLWSWTKAPESAISSLKGGDGG
jgi:hypothetical protein